MSRVKENLAIVAHLYGRWAASNGLDTSCWLEAMAEDVRTASIGEGVEGLTPKTGANRDRVMEYFNQLREHWEMLEHSVERFVAQGPNVVMIGRVRWRHRRTQKVLESPKVDILTLRQGKIVEIFGIYNTAAALEAGRD